MIACSLNDMAIKIRTVNLRGLENVSLMQLCIVVIIALLCVGLMIFLDKKKPEWKGGKSKVITIAAAVILIGIVIFAL